MGKQGPCFHCGITTTCLWRNGPPEKPVLCNACGARWRTKGTFANYMPRNTRGPSLTSYKTKKSTTADNRKDKGKSKKEPPSKHSLKRSTLCENKEDNDVDDTYWNNILDSYVNNVINGSSSTSILPNSGRRQHFDNSNISDGMLTPKERLLSSSDEKKTEDIEKSFKTLRPIMNRQLVHVDEQDVLLYKNDTPDVPQGNIEFLTGCILLKPPVRRNALSRMTQITEYESQDLQVNNTGMGDDG
ncbi:hypothetical protein ZOSMA_36G00040 [Zostera marina]|uniref:GATA-type domain-containing protein n=1 Tax=Zostera marina TaxID=29655 RepID=A0A0K9P811_ZOSMR|nr:hypothetical protein ZOSMA_36G00040 [Zostera marina]